MQIERSKSSLSDDQLAGWRVFLETSLALIDIVDDELQTGRGLTLRWYDVLVHLEAADEGLRMNELAGRILSSKSGLTRVVDKMDEAGLVQRERPPGDRRAVIVRITPQGLDELRAARVVHWASIEEHFARQLSARDLVALSRALQRVHDHVRPLRPGRVSDPNGGRGTG